MSKIVVEKCYPNAHGWLKLVHDNEAGDWYVRAPDSNGDPDDVTAFDVFEEAKAFYDAEAKRWANLPNWEAQAAYDEAHGTDNGFAPWDQRREY